MAVVCYEVLAGRKPYDAEDYSKVLKHIKKGGPDLQYVPEEYRSVLSKAFKVRKDDRYQRAVDLADELKRSGRTIH